MVFFHPMKTSVTAALVIAALLGSGARPAFASPRTSEQEAVIQQEVRSRMHGFVAAIGTTSADGLAKIAQLSYFGLTNYPKGQVTVTAESDTAVTMQCNRAYLAYFKKGPVLGVTVDEFERCFGGHFAIMAGRNGFGFTHRVEAEKVTFTISLEK